MSSRKSRRSGGTAFPWKTFQVRTSSGKGRISLGSVLRRGRFGDVISRQLDLFEREQAGLMRQCEEAEAAYDRAERDEAEERFGDYQDLVETGTELLADL